MMTATNRKLSDATRFLADQAYTGASTGLAAARVHYSLSATGPGARSGGARSPSPGCSRATSTASSGPTPSTSTTTRHERFSTAHRTGVVRPDRRRAPQIQYERGYRSPGFEINDVGYLRRADEAHFSNWLQLRRDQPTTHLRSYRVNFNQWNGWNFGRRPPLARGNVNAHAVFTSNWRVGGGFSLNAAGFDDRATRGGPGVLDNREINYWVYVGSDDRRALSFEIEHFLAADWYGSTAWQVAPSLVCRPSTALELTGGIAVNRNVDDAQWVGNVTGASEHYVFAHLDQTTLSFTRG